MKRLSISVLTAATLLAAANLPASHNSPAAVEARTAPVGRLNVVDDAAAATAAPATAAAAPSGAEVYAAACVACHGAGIAGAPKTGDAAQWKARMAQGMAVLVRHAIDGYRGEDGFMPARGGNPDLSDDEVAAAVAHMAESLQPQGADGAAAATASSTAAAAPSGAEVYAAACVACHGAGIAGAPKTGDAAQWKARMAQGMAVLVRHAIEGYRGEGGFMPARGGNPDLSDDEVAAAVAHMIEGLQ